MSDVAKGATHKLVSFFASLVNDWCPVGNWSKKFLGSFEEVGRIDRLTENPK